MVYHWKLLLIKKNYQNEYGTCKDERNDRLRNKKQI